MIRLEWERVSTFRERCDEDHEFVLKDGTEKHFFNCCYEGDDMAEELREFYDYVSKDKVGSDLTQRINDAVVHGRLNEVWRSEYIRERQILMDAKEEGREEGLLESVKKLMKNLKVSAEQAMDSLEIPEDMRQKYLSML